MSRSRILLADDHPVMLGKVRSWLEKDFEVVGAVEDGQALISAAAEMQPDVVILDITMPGINGIEAAKQLRQVGSRAKIIFLTVHEDPDFRSEALFSGALGYVLKSRLTLDLIPAIHEAIANKFFMSPLQANNGSR